MKWPWQKRGMEEAERLERTHERLAQVHRRWPQVRDAARTMQHHREVNGFAEAIRTAMGVRR